MAEIASTTAGTGTETAQAASNAPLRDVDLDSFIKLLVTELSNQDPLNPQENTEVLQTISNIREIEATDKMTQTLDAVLLGQRVSAASNLIGKQIEGLSAGEDGQFITGIVDRVSIVDGLPKLHIGEQTVDLQNVREIRPDADSTKTTD